VIILATNGKTTLLSGLRRGLPKGGNSPAQSAPSKIGTEATRPLAPFLHGTRCASTGLILEMNSTHIRQHLNAPRSAVYRALIDPQAIAQWRVPDGMTAEVHAFDAREGGAFRISLMYETAEGAGKTSAQTDTYHGRFLKLVPDEQVVEVEEFETDDPALAGEMKSTITLRDASGGTELVAVHENLPPGLSPADNEAGWKMSLAKLAKWLEAEEPGRSGA
jgi:uncharacterized protein YndB with AHSA1/START domain